MKRQKNPVEFAANPFIALADCVIVLLLILVLAVVHSNISSQDAVQRVAIAQLQNQLLQELGINNGTTSVNGTTTHPAERLLLDAYHANAVIPAYRDGDLQRFWFSGDRFFEKGSARMKPKAERILAAFGKVLSRHQGDRTKRGNGLFKYLLVEGHADSDEGSPPQVQALASLRAAEAARVLRAGDTPHGVAPSLIRAYGRSDLDPTYVNFERGPFRRFLERRTRSQLAELNKRIELVVVYSGQRAIHYLSQEPPQASTK